MKGKKRLFLIFGSIAILVVLFAQCMNNKKAAPATENTIAGAATCKQCHAAITDSYLENPHQHTSHPIEGDELLNGPLPHSSVFAFDQHLKVVVEKRDSGMYQVAYLDGKETIARRFDIAFGAGVKAYTYGSWQGNELKQLPLSYFKTIQSWANSPGFPSDRVYFDRPIGLRCLECHSSFVNRKMVQDGPLTVKEELDGKSLVYGIDCERCHGPAGKHVEFHLSHPEAKAAKYIAIYKTLTRQQKIDACAVCHSGNNWEVQQSTFSFKPGDDIKRYRSAKVSLNSSKEPEYDVHGTQSQLLEKSKCFMKSNTIDCSSCHRTHENLKGNLTIYSQRCMSCHTTIKHSQATLANAMVKTNCIDCHMPKQASKMISFQLAGKNQVSTYLLRTHRIAVY
ncbi:cytochrome c3 family protein [Pedobacter sp. L105]|uniref:cytochrome c3 family protein n=1 Tax=Pedobacter sp. L105 TaxID=1641871 RepID=UPI00131E95E5|nr:cytochrome c3 family protein [Pedobacter sp. L105]